MAVILQCIPAGHVFSARVGFGDSLYVFHCPSCGKVVPTKKP